MALTKATFGVTNISDLSSTPNATEGLTAAQLQAKFDKTGADAKTYINDTLTAEIDSIFANEKIFTTVEAGSNGDFYCTLADTSLTTNRIIRISIPAATNGASNARLSINGSGGTFKNIKLLRGSQLLASDIENTLQSLYYNGTDFIIFTNMIAKYIVPSATGAVTISGLDILKDKGCYNIEISGATTSGTAIVKIAPNNDDSSWMGVRRIETDTRTTNGDITAAANKTYYYASTTSAMGSLTNGALGSITCQVVQNAGLDTTMRSEYYALRSGSQEFGNQFKVKTLAANITSIVFTAVSDTFVAGTVIKIYKCS